MRARRGIAMAVVAMAVAASPAAAATEPLELVGALHEHSGYSDGWPGSTPRNYFAAGRQEGLDFLGSSEHSDNADVPAVASEYCAEDPAACLNADPVNPLDAFRKWDATLEQAQAATDAGFAAFRGFEWTSDRFGHINVYFSTEDVNAKADGGYATMDAFYAWLTRPAELGGGSDGLATFNHPGAKHLHEADPGLNWDDFAYRPEVDAQMVGMEVFNDRQDYGADGAPGDPPPGGWYARALDRGWHVGAIGAEDLGHKREDDWGGPDRAKTVVLAAQRTPEAIRAALQQRRFYAVRRPNVRLRFTVDGAPMGSRLARPAAAPLRVRASVTAPGVSGLKLDVITTAGAVVASGGRTLDVRLPKGTDRPYLYVRARAGEEAVAYSSPIWVERAATGGEWLAGDLHVHSCFSGDVYCGPSDEPLTIEPGDDPENLAAEIGDYISGPVTEAYTYGLTVGQRFAEAGARGLDFTAITDHNDTRSAADPSFGAAGVIGVPGYERSLDGHAQVLGSEEVLDDGDGSAAGVRKLAGAVRARGGALQINHPGYRDEAPFATCDATTALHWKYGYAIRPDTLEVWNPTSAVAPAEAYLECWLQRGERVAATAGSDTHWAALTAVQGQGNPTTWVFARDRSRAGVLQALRAGRTTLSRTPPGQNPARLLLEADADGDGEYEAAIGDTVKPGTAMRVRAEGGPAVGYVTVRANGGPLITEAPLGPGESLPFEAPLGDGWVRATLLAGEGAAQEAPGCEPTGQSVSTCAYDQLLLAMTSPIYLRAEGGSDPDPEPDPSPTPSPSPQPQPQPNPPPSPSPQPGPGPGPAAESSPAAAPTPAARPPATAERAARLELRRRPLRSTVRRRRGIRLRVVCRGACDAAVAIRHPRTRAVLGRTRVVLPRGGSRTRLVRLPRRTVSQLRRGDVLLVTLRAGGRTSAVPLRVR